jgi:hypothetical protein
MGEQFVKYRTFNDKALAAALCQLLADHNIPYVTESTEGFFDVSFANNEILNLYYVKLFPQDFRRADELLNNVVEKDPGPVGDYYLFSFSNDELIDVLTKPDEWNAFDLYWARKILKTRGAAIDDIEIARARENRIEQLRKPWKLEGYWLLLPLLLCLLAFFFFHVASAFALVFLGSYVTFSKKTLPDGMRVLAFSAGDRRLGRVILGAGIVAALAAFALAAGYVPFSRPL